MKWASLTLPAAMLSGAAVAQSHTFSHVMGRSVPEKPATTVKPAVHEDTALKDLEQLRPKTNVTLFYGEEGANPNKKSAFGVLELLMKYPAVALEHSAFIQDISCHVGGQDGKDEDGHVVAKGQEGVDIQFTSKKAYDEACKTWPTSGKFVIITHHKGCGKYEQGIRSYHLVNGYTTEESKLSITAKSAEKELKDCMNQATLSWGHYEAQNNHAQAHSGSASTDLKRRQAGDAPGPAPDVNSQTPQQIIENGFDFQRDTKLGFFDIQQQDNLIDQLLLGLPAADKAGLKQDAKFMEHSDKNVAADNDDKIEGVTAVVLQIPTDGATPPAAAKRIKKRAMAHYARSRDMRNKHMRRAMLEKRWGFLDRIGKAVSGFVENVITMPAKIVATVTDFVKKPSVGGFVEILAATPAGAVAKLAGGLIVGDVTIDGSRTYGIEVPGPNQIPRVETPWGQGIEIFKKEKTTENGKGSGSITLWCVGCGLKGELNVAGTVTFSGFKITAGKVNIKGNMQFQLVAGLKAEFQYHDKQQKQLVDVNVGPFQIAGIAEAGFFVGISLNTEFDVKAEGQLQAGFRVEWNDVNAYLDIVDGSKSSLEDLKAPKFHPIFDAKGDIAIGAEIGPSLSLSFGIKLLSSETLSAKVALIESPSISGVAKFSGHAGLNPDTGKVVGAVTTEGCAGVSIGFAVNNNLYLTLNAGGKELKTIEMDRRGLYEKKWCLAPEAAPAATPVAAKIKVKRQGDAAPTATGQDFELGSTEANLFTTLSAQAPTMTGEIVGATPFTEETNMGETDHEDLSRESANELLEDINNDHKDAAKASTDTSAAITHAAITTEDKTVALFTGVDGNILSLKLSETTKTADDAFNFQVFGTTIISDVGERIIHVYTDSQEQFGVSRLRVSPLNAVPAKTQMVVLREYSGALVAVSTDQKFFGLVVCEVTVLAVKVNKMYAIDLGKHDIDAGIKVLTSESTDDVVTGGKADRCAAVPFRIQYAVAPPSLSTGTPAPVATPVAA